MPGRISGTEKNIPVKPRTADWAHVRSSPIQHSHLEQPQKASPTNGPTLTKRATKQTNKQTSQKPRKPASGSTVGIPTTSSNVPRRSFDETTARLFERIVQKRLITSACLVRVREEWLHSRSTVQTQFRQQDLTPSSVLLPPKFGILCDGPAPYPEMPPTIQSTVLRCAVLCCVGEGGG